jgi:ABC-type branched-subunit amino acid transport system substrate-binding protein
MARIASGVLVALLGLTGCVGEARQPPAELSMPAAPPESVAREPLTTVIATTSVTTAVPAESRTRAVPATTSTISTSIPIPAPQTATLLEAATGVPVLVAGVLPLSGDSRSRGSAQADAIQLAIEAFGTIADHDVELARVEDSRCSVDGGRAASRAIVALGATIESSPVVGVIGPGCDAAAIEAVPLLVGQGFAVVSPSVREDDFTADAFGLPGALWAPGLFTLEPSDHAEAVAAARFAVLEREASAPVVIRLADDEHGEISARLFTETLTTFAVSPVAEIVVAPDGVPGQLAHLADLSPDALFVAIGSSEAGVVLEALSGIEGLDDADRIVLGDALLTDVAHLDVALGAYVVMADGWAGGQDVTGTTYGDVRSEYERRFGREPTLDAVRAYDATMLLLSAVARVAEDRDGTLVIDRRRIVEALFDADQPGFSGRLVCGRNGNCLQVRVRVFQHTGDLPGTLANEVWIDD